MVTPCTFRSWSRSARPGQPGRPRLPEAQIVRRRVSIRGAIMIGGQRIQVGLPHAGQTAQVFVEADTYRIAVEVSVAASVARNDSREIRRHKASHYPAGDHQSPPNILAARTR
jgi:hypothetical protein